MVKNWILRTLHKILVAIDGSPSSLNAVEYAIELAKETRSELEIVYIIRYAMGNIEAGILPHDIEKKEEEKAILLINKIKESHGDVKIRDFETVGRPVIEITKEINTWGADLLVIGHHSHSFLDKLLTNSVEDDLLKSLKIPLLTIPKKYKFAKYSTER